LGHERLAKAWEFSVLHEWFFTRRDGTRVGPFAPLALDRIASTDLLQAPPPARKGVRAKPGRVERLLHAVTGQPGDDTV